MNDRLTTIQSWCDKRGINQVITFFRGCSSDQSMYDENYARIGAVLRRKQAQVSDTDEYWIADMENTINKLNA